MLRSQNGPLNHHHNLHALPLYPPGHLPVLLPLLVLKGLLVLAPLMRKLLVLMAAVLWVVDSSSKVSCYFIVEVGDFNSDALYRDSPSIIIKDG